MKTNVVIQTAFLGDLILTIPFLQKLKKIFPNHKLAIVCKQGLGDFLIKLKIVDSVYEVIKNDRISYHQTTLNLNSIDIDNLYCVHRSLRSQLMSLRIKAQKKIGYKSFINWIWFDKYVSYPKNWPDVLRKFVLIDDTEVYSELNKINNISELNRANELGQLPIFPDFFKFQNIENLMGYEKKNQVCIFPGSVWATKKWTESGFIRLSKKFSDLGYAVLLMGSKEEKELCERISKQTPHSEVLAGNLSIFDSIVEIAKSKLVVANDSAASHMAALVSSPSVTLFGPTILEFGFRPWNINSLIVENRKINCRPCGAHGPQKCPLVHHNCMKEISEDQVLQACLKIMIQ